ncbi:MAG: hypothetical protein ACYCYF_03405, partial [Anaerolineae bacterium]
MALQGHTMRRPTPPWRPAEVAHRSPVALRPDTVRLPASFGTPGARRATEVTMGASSPFRRRGFRTLLTIVLTLLLLLGPCVPPSSAQTELPAAEYEALLAFFAATGGPAWTNTWTLPTEAPCSLIGVQCTDTVPRHVSGIGLSSNNLTGALPYALTALTFLQVLSLSHNHLGGPVPPWLSQLTNLTRIDLQGNQFAGAIPPQLGSLPLLDTLGLASNSLTGAIPHELGNAPALVILDLSYNQLTGTIPEGLASLSNLLVLNLAGNQLTGAIPVFINGLTDLVYLVLSENQLTGGIPPGLGNLTHLEYLS